MTFFTTHHCRSRQVTRGSARLLRISEAAAMLSVSTVTIRRHVKAGRLPHVRINNRLYFQPMDIQRFIDAHRAPVVF